MKADPIPCPVCLHEETLRARIGDREPCYDDSPLMDWAPPPGGPGAAVCTIWDGGAWVCRVCGIRMPPHHAGVLLDAALMHMDPDCDSIRDGLHEDARRAFEGGRER